MKYLKKHLARWINNYWWHFNVAILYVLYLCLNTHKFTQTHTRIYSCKLCDNRDVHDLIKDKYRKRISVFLLTGPLFDHIKYETHLDHTQFWFIKLYKTSFRCLLYTRPLYKHQTNTRLQISNINMSLFVCRTVIK